MADLVAQFEQLIYEIGPETRGGSVQILLATLSPETAQLLKLGAIPHHYSPKILRVMKPELSEQEAQERYLELIRLPVSSQMVDFAILHDSERRFLFQQWLDVDRVTELAAVSQRLVNYFREAAGDANAANWQRLQLDIIFHWIGAARDEGFGALKKHWRSSFLEFRLSDCSSLIKLAREYDSRLDAVQLLWLDYYDALLASELGQDEEALASLQMLIEKPITRSDIDLHIQARVREGMILGRQGHWDRALSCFYDARQIAKSGGASTKEAEIYFKDGDILYEIGSALCQEGALDDAERELIASINYFDSRNDTNGLAKAQNGIGTVYLKMGELERAIQCYEKAREYLSLAGDRYQVAELLNNLGVVYARQLKWNEAEGHYKDSLTLKKQIGDTRGQAVCLNNLSQAYLNLNRFDDAISCGEEALARYLELRDYLNAACAKRDLARLYLKHDFAAATLRFSEAIELFRKSGVELQAIETEKELRNFNASVPWWGWLALIIVLFMVTAVGYFVFDSLEKGMETTSPSRDSAAEDRQPAPQNAPETSPSNSPANESKGGAPEKVAPNLNATQPAAPAAGNVRQQTHEKRRRARKH